MRQKIHEKDLTRRLTEHFGLLTYGGENFRTGEVNIRELASKLATRNIADIDEFACSEIFVCMEAYYKVSLCPCFLGNQSWLDGKVVLKSFVDNVAILTVEACLMKDLGMVFSPISVMQMEENVVRRIASETRENQDQRELLTRKKTVLTLDLEICQRYVDRNTLT